MVPVYLPQGHSLGMSNKEAAQMLIYPTTVPLRQWRWRTPQDRNSQRHTDSSHLPISAEKQPQSHPSDCSGKLYLMFSLNMSALGFVYAIARLTDLQGNTAQGSVCEGSLWLEPQNFSCICYSCVWLTSSSLACSLNMKHEYTLP